MAKLTRDDILKLARLSRLTLTDEEIEQFTNEISSLLEYVEVLNEADIENVEPTYQVTGLKDVMRPDDVTNYGPDTEDLLQNAPATEAGHFKVKRMVQ